MELIILVSLWVIFLGMLFYAHTNTLRLLFVYALGVLIFFPSVFALMLAWVFNGIGPYEEYSEGWDAWYLFLRDTWPFLLLVTVFIVAGYFANRRAYKRVEANRVSQKSVLGV